jgi:fructose-bisphosphate aldolase, class II
MTLVNTGTMLLEAKKQGYCVGAFNVVDFLSMEAVVRAAENSRSPIIMQTSTPIVKQYGARAIVQMAQVLTENSTNPVGLHLDHGMEPEIIQECIKAGYTSVMIDASKYPFEENVLRTRQVVEWAHQVGIAVEGEIGVLAGVEDDIVVDQDDAIYTTPEEAIAFQEQSGVDFLAVAIGTAHGFYKVVPRLDIDVLRQIHSQVDFPLVVHGGTGLSDEILEELVQSGADKMNVSTQLKKTYIDGLRSYIENQPNEYDPLKLLNYAKESLVNVICDYLQVFGSAHRA